MKNWPSGNLLLQPQAESDGYRFEIVLGTGKFGMPSITAFPELGQGNISPVREIVGPKTGLSWPTGIARDPKSGELWVANAIGDKLTIYASDANGDAAPVRVIAGPKTMLKNPTSVVIDSAHNEVWVANYGAHTAVAFNLAAKGDVAPVRLIQGPSTRLRDPEKISIDGVHNEVFAFNMTIHNEILVFDSKKSGDQAPKRVLTGGDKYRFGNLFVDTTRDLLVLSGSERGPNGGPRIFIFDRKASGMAEPLRKINAAGGAIRIVPKTGKIAVTVGGGDDGDARSTTVDETGERHSNAHVNIYDINDSGAVQPEWSIGKGKLLDIRGLALDTRNKTVIISDKGLQGVLTFSLPEIF